VERLVDNNQTVLYGNFFLLQPVADRFPAQVHESIGFQQDQGTAFPFHLGEVSVVIAFPVAAQCGADKVQHVKSDVVTCVVVIVADIAEACDQIFHIFKKRAAKITAWNSFASKPRIHVEIRFCHNALNAIWLYGQVAGVAETSVLLLADYPGTV
jgi:hypothetical protein